MTTSVASVSPRLISAVSPEPGRLLAAAAAELARRWASGDYDLGAADALADLGYIRDALRSLTGLFDNESNVAGRNLYDFAYDLADDRLASRHADKRAVRARTALNDAAGELTRALDRGDDGYGW